MIPLMKYFPCFHLWCSALSGSLGGKSKPEFQGFSFIDDLPFFPPTKFCGGICSYTEEFVCWSTCGFHSKGVKAPWYVPTCERFSIIHHYRDGWLEGWSCIQRELERFRWDYCIIMFEIEFSWVVCPLKLEISLLDYFNRMLQPCVDALQTCWQSCRHWHWDVLCVLCGVFAQQVHAVYPGACKCTNTAKLMEQGRAEIPKSVGWMVLWQNFLVLPQDCILVLQWGWWWWGHFGHLSTKSYIRKPFFFSWLQFWGRALLAWKKEDGIFSSTQKRSILLPLPFWGLSTSLSFSSSNWQDFFCLFFFFPLTQVPIPKTESDVEVLLVNC